MSAPERTCLSGKHIHATKGEARAALRAVQARRRTSRGRNAGVESSVYRCLTCDGWHLTSHAQTPRRRR